MIETLFVSPVSACFELRNDAPYYAPASYRVWLDDVEQFAGNTNVCSPCSPCCREKATV